MPICLRDFHHEKTVKALVVGEHENFLLKNDEENTQVCVLKINVGVGVN